MGISYRPSNSNLPNQVTASGDMHISGNLVVDGVLTAAGISGSGEANTASNVGSGTGVFKGKTGVDLEFKTLVGSGVTINSKTNTIELTASGGGGSTNPGGSNTQVQFNQNGSFAGDSGFTYDGSGSVFVSSSFTASSLQLYNEETSSQTIDFSVLSNGAAVLKKSGSNPDTLFLRSENDQQSFIQFQANGGTATGFTGSLTKGVTIGLNGKDGYFLTRDSGSLFLGTNNISAGITIDPGRNATFVANLNANGNATLGDASSDFHKISGSLNISGSQVGLLHVRGDVTASNNISASAFHGDGSNLTNLPAGSPGGSNTQVQFNNNGSFSGSSGFTYDGTGSVSFGSATSDTHQVTGTLSISGSQPLKVFGPQGGGGGASIIARHTSSIDDWETPISGALVVSADAWTVGEQYTGAVMYVHSQNNAATIGFKNSSTLVGSPGEQKNVVTDEDAKGAYAGLVGSNIIIRNEISSGKIELNTGNTEFSVDDSGVIIGNSVSDVHQVTGTLSISGSQVGLLHVRGDITASNNISASAFYGDGSNLQNVTGAATPPGGSNTQIQFNDAGSFSGSSGLTFATGSNTLTVTNLTASSVDINGGTIEGSDITVDAGKTLDVSNGTLTLALNQISGDSINGGTIDSITIETLTSTSVTASSAEISAGTIDETTIGGTTPASGTFTTVSASLMQNTYYSASINSNTSVPTNQYNFINYQLGASLALTASSPVAGASYIILLRQDATGGRVVSFDSSTFKFPSGSNTTNSTGSSDVDIVTGISDGSVIYAAMNKKFI